MSVSNLSIYCLNDHFIFKFSYSDDFPFIKAFSRIFIIKSKIACNLIKY